MESPGPAAADAALTDKVRAEQVRLVYGNGDLPMIATGLTAAVLSGLLIWLGTLTPTVAAIWLAVMATHISVRIGLRRTYLKAPNADSDWRKWGRRHAWGALAGGLSWGLGAFWILPAGRQDLQMLVIVAMVAIMFGTLVAFGAYAPSFYAFFLSAFAPTVAWALWQGGAVHLSYVAMSVLFIPSVMLLAQRHNQSIAQALTLRFENAALAESLQAQKQIAEQASLAKSRFLANASHDLRQPVHALGMLIGALKNHNLPPRSAVLVEQVDASIGALDGLFSSLLDISRLDAGVVDAQLTPMAIQPLLVRLQRDLAPEAAAKGVRLVLAPTTASVLSDPMLLERVLRNLIGNAVRYTGTGKVLVGCRRRGERLSIEVWDTGPGIAEHLREAVFEEFYQIANPDRDRSKGLGLGLPIVRRLAAILDHPLEMQSTQGRGSLFRVLAPRAQRPSQASVEAPAPAPPAAGIVLVIDDELAIRTAMSELLTGWGCGVVVAGGGEEAMIAAKMGPRPDLVLCDYRLRGDDGVEVIRKLRARLGQDLPAVLITGDTAPEARARAEGCVLLHKPLTHDQLRAAIGPLLEARRAQAGAV